MFKVPRIRPGILISVFVDTGIGRIHGMRQRRAANGHLGSGGTCRHRSTVRFRSHNLGTCRYRLGGSHRGAHTSPGGNGYGTNPRHSLKPPRAKSLGQSSSMRASFGGILRNAESVLPDHWDLHQSCCNPGPAASRDLFNNLLIYDPTDQLTLVGDLAKSWEWSEDGMTVTFNLWENAVWSDGEPVTADDVVFSLDRMIQKDFSRPRVKNITPYLRRLRSHRP